MATKVFKREKQVFESFVCAICEKKLKYLDKDEKSD
jgi:hypothetical protein